MSRHTIRLMASIERRLNTYVKKEVTACGHAENLRNADKARDRLMQFLEREIEALVEKAGLS